MNTITKSVFLLAFTLASIFSSAQQRRIYFTEFYGEFLGNLAVDQSGVKTPVGSYGFGAHVCTGQEHFSSILEYNFRRVNLEELSIAGAEKVNIHEFYLGIRYFPMRPTFMIGNTALRLTFGAQYGLDLEPNWRGLLFAGIAVSPIQFVSGVSVNVVYRPGAHPASGYLLDPGWTIRTALVLGPTTQ